MRRSIDKGAPEPGKQYHLTGPRSIAAGNTWAESEVGKEHQAQPEQAEHQEHTEQPEQRESLTDYFGPVISSYSRAQAIEDGVLADVSETEAAKLFKHPVAITSDLWDVLVKGKGAESKVWNARLWDVCYMARHGKIDGPDSWFKVIVGNRTLELRANCGPGDDGAPVMTIGFPGDF